MGYSRSTSQRIKIFDVSLLANDEKMLIAHSKINSQSRHEGVMGYFRSMSQRIKIFDVWIYLLMRK